MGKLLIAIVLLGAVAIGAELAAPRLLEAGTERRVREVTDGATTVEANAGSFPFLPRLIGDGQIAHLTVRMDDVAFDAVAFSRLVLTMEDIHVSRSALLRGEADVRRIERGELLAEVTASELGAAMDLADDQLGELLGDAAVQDAVLSFGAGAFELAMPEELLPCTPDVEVDGGLLRLTCAFDEVPYVLLDAVEGASS